MKQELASKLLRSGEISRRDFAVKTASSLLGVGLRVLRLPRCIYEICDGCQPGVFPG